MDDRRVFRSIEHAKPTAGMDRTDLVPPPDQASWRDDRRVVRGSDASGPFIRAPRFPGSWAALLLWEARHLWRAGSIRWTCGALLLAGVLAVWNGATRLEEHRREVAHLPAHYDAQMARITPEFTPSGPAGYVAYYTFFPTHHELSPLGALAFGVRDLVPEVVWVRLLGLEGQIYDGDIGNPALQALGSFDLAFVWCAFAPLALLVSGHDVLTRDRDGGRLPLITVQRGSLTALLLVRVGVRFAAVGLAGSVAFGIAAAWLRIPLDPAALGWLAAAWAQLACWAGITALIAVLARSVAASLAFALTSWVTAVVLVPALLNLVLVTIYPVREGLDVTVRQRQESHAAWDKPRAETMEKFFAHNPDWSGTPPIEGRFAWRWYYAMQEMGDQSVAAESLAYRENLRARQSAITRFAWLVPPAYAQLALSARSGTDLDAHLDYLDRVRAFHRELKEHFYPLFFAEASLTPADYATFPQFHASHAGRHRAPPLWPLLGATVVFVTLALWRVRRASLFVSH